MNRGIYKRSNISPKTANLPLTSSRAVFVPKRFYLELTIDPISLDRPPSKVGVNPLQNSFTLHVSYNCHT